MNGPAVHGTVVALRGSAGWTGVLLRGTSGAGKSDLALRLIASGARLVADDYAVLWASGGRLYATAPETIAGRIEARGLGIVSQPTRWIAPVGLIVDLTSDAVERMPEPRKETLRGVSLPALLLDARPASATILIALSLSLSRWERDALSAPPTPLPSDPAFNPRRIGLSRPALTTRGGGVALVKRQ